MTDPSTPPESGSDEERRPARGSASVPSQPGVIGREPIPTTRPTPGIYRSAPPPVAAEPAPNPPPGPPPPPAQFQHPGPQRYGLGRSLAAPTPPRAQAPAPAPAPGPAPAPAPAPTVPTQRPGPRHARPDTERRDAAPAPAPPLTAQPLPGQTLTGPAVAAAATASAAAAVVTEANPFAGPSAGGPVALPDADRGDPGGGDSQALGTVAAAPSGRMPRLRVGWHTVATAALAPLAVTAPASGLVLGADRRRDPVAVRLFAPEPTRVALVGGAWPAYLVALRALALGARITVVTADPANWAGFGQWAASGPGDEVAVVAGEQSVALAGSPQRPALVVYDLGVAGARAPAPLGPWQTQLTVLRRLDRPGVGVVQESSLTLLQRLDATESLIAGSALRLPPHSGRFLQVMADDMLAIVAGGADRYIWVTPTRTELHYAGPPRR